MPSPPETTLDPHHIVSGALLNQLASTTAPTVELVALQDGSFTELLLHPTYCPVYADNRVGIGTK